MKRHLMTTTFLRTRHDFIWLQSLKLRLIWSKLALKERGL